MLLCCDFWLLSISTLELLDSGRTRSESHCGMVVPALSWLLVQMTVATKTWWSSHTGECSDDQGRCCSGRSCSCVPGDRDKCSSWLGSMRTQTTELAWCPIQTAHLLPTRTFPLVPTSTSDTSVPYPYSRIWLTVQTCPLGFQPPWNLQYERKGRLQVSPNVLAP